MDTRVQGYLQPPYKRSGLLYAIKLISGRQYLSVADLRRAYPHFPRPLPLDKLAKLIHELDRDLLAWEQYRYKKPSGRPLLSDSAELVQQAQTLRSEGKSYAAVGKIVGRSHEWVRQNCG
jgi:hypothetical protein